MTPEESFATFYRGQRDRCLRTLVAAGRTRPAAEDAVAEAFARAWASWPSVSAHPAPAAWVVRVALNADVSWWRRRRRERPAPDDDARPDGGEDPAPALADRVDLVAALARLPPRQREVLALRYLLDLDTAATAQVLGIAPGTVSSTVHAALRSLRASGALVRTGDQNRTGSQENTGTRNRTGPIGDLGRADPAHRTPLTRKVAP